MKLCPKLLLGLDVECGREISDKYDLGLCEYHSLEELGERNLDKLCDDVSDDKTEETNGLACVREAKTELMIQKYHSSRKRVNFAEMSAKSKKASMSRWEKVRKFRDSLPYACNLRQAEKMMRIEENKKK